MDSVCRASKRAKTGAIRSSVWSRMETKARPNGALCVECETHTHTHTKAALGKDRAELPKSRPIERQLGSQVLRCEQGRGETQKQSRRSERLEKCRSEPPPRLPNPLWWWSQTWTFGKRSDPGAQHMLSVPSQAHLDVSVATSGAGSLGSILRLAEPSPLCLQWPRMWRGAQVPAPP